MQAHEAIKFLTGSGTLLKNRLLIWDGRDSSVTFLDLEPDPECRACGTCTQNTGSVKGGS
jgi:adenylyltransferase/sulfurtransferase